MNWKSVKKELPKKDGRYLVCIGEDKYITILFFAKNGKKIDKYELSAYKNFWYEDDSEWGFCVWDSITHWQELPESPK